MQRTIGVVTAERVAVGVVEQNQLVRPLRFFPERGSEADDLHGLAAEEISQLICEQIELALEGGEVSAVGIGFPGIIRNGIIEDSPNLHQVKGLNLQQAVAASLARRGINVPVVVSNDADVMAAGIAATQGYLDRVVRVWKLGQGIGFGLYPATDGVWEGGHTVVSLDPQERYCGCGGRGHLEGIMGYRAMRLRFLDMEPEEIFETAKTGDPRCLDFVSLWHRALAAATASSIHMVGPGKFFITGPSARFVVLSLLNRYMQDMVKMSPLQGYVFEIVPGGDEVAVIGAAVNADRASGRDHPRDR